NDDNNNNKMNNIGVIGGNGYTICSGSMDNTIRIWDIETTKQFNMFKGHAGYVISVKYGSNELLNTILSGSFDKSVRLWDIRSGEQIQVFNGHTNEYDNTIRDEKEDDGISCLKFIVLKRKRRQRISNNDLNLCCGSKNGPIRIWG
ncbi:WD-40 repeat protein, partial [Reticulomyxa filosa]